MNSLFNRSFLEKLNEQLNEIMYSELSFLQKQYLKKLYKITAEQKQNLGVRIKRQLNAKKQKDRERAQRVRRKVNARLRAETNTL